MFQKKKGGGKNVIVMKTCKDNLTPLLYNGKKKKKKKIIISVNIKSSPHPNPWTGTLIFA